MKKISIVWLVAALVCLPSCEKKEPVEPKEPEVVPGDTVPASQMQRVALHSSLTHAQPMTGLVLWPDQAEDLDEAYRDAISMEFVYCLPCRVVTGKDEGGNIQYDWTYLEDILDDIVSRNHQAILRFRYEYPGSRDVDPNHPGTTAVPLYIKDLNDYHESFNDVDGDGPTYYADWSNTELQRFTLQFYTDFCKRYAHDPRLAFLEVGFGHWSEYHIYGTTLQLGVNFPSKAYQKQFFQHMSTVADGLPWLVSIDASDDEYSPVVDDQEIMALDFGLFEDSFMHKDHEIGTNDGYNEECWNAIGKGTRWKTGVCGGEISYYKDSDQKNFLNPNGMYGHTWEEQAAKYHITFMIANDAPSGTYGTAARFREATLASGYQLSVKECATDGTQTRLLVTNEGIAPLYRDAWFAIGDVRSETSLCGLLPNEEKEVLIAAVPKSDGSDIQVQSDCILASQEMEFKADLEGPTGLTVIDKSTEQVPAAFYSLSGQQTTRQAVHGIAVERRGQMVRKYIQK